jgi:hypothetical protein
MKDKLTIEDLADECPALTPRYQQRLRSEGRVAFIKVGKKIIYRRTDIETLLANHRVEAAR